MLGFFLKEWVNVTLIIPHVAPGQLPPPASQGKAQRRGGEKVFEKTSSGCEGGGGAGSADAATRGLAGGAPQEHSPRFAIRSDGISIGKKIPLQQTKELHSSLGKNVFQGLASELNKTRISLGGP